ncbi:MAG TPA: AAA family ATPase, partial [Nitriliruptorales bacterium]|nr:AAA family ATPase [Nitriliruptorales bacterium]
MSDIASLSEAPLPPLSPLVLQMRRTTGALVGRANELTAVRQEIAAAKKGQLAALTFEGEPGIGKSRLLLAASDVAEAEDFVVVAVAADEEIRGPFLLARAIFGCREAQEAAAGVARDDFQRAHNAISGLDDPTLEGLSPDHKLLRTFDLGAIAMRSLASRLPVALLVDDLQWADEDSVRMLRYIVRADADLPIFLAFAVRRDELALTTEAAPLLADMERLGLVRRISLPRLTQLESTALLKQALGGDVAATSAATMHAQSEGVPFILEELARA